MTHVLILFAPKPTRFFGWVIALATIGAMAARAATRRAAPVRAYR